MKRIVLATLTATIIAVAAPASAVPPPHLSGKVEYVEDLLACDDMSYIKMIAHIAGKKSPIEINRFIGRLIETPRKKYPGSKACLFITGEVWVDHRRIHITFHNTDQFTMDVFFVLTPQGLPYYAWHFEMANDHAL
jgi:hypothetical protein